MKDEIVNHERRRILSVGAAVLASPILGVGLVEARGGDADSGMAPGEPTQKSPERIAEFEAGIRLGAKSELGPIQLFSPLAIGDAVGFGWRLSAMRGPERGAILVALSRDEDTARVHVYVRQQHAAARKQGGLEAVGGQIVAARPAPYVIPLDHE